MSAIDMITAETMQSLVTHGDPPCVSMYMPTHRAGRETQQDPIRLGNLVDEACSELRSWMRKPEAERLVRDARRLTDSGGFWQHQEDGLAVFVAPGRTETYRVPVSLDELVVVSDTFHVKPLWPVVTGDDIFYLLALSRNEVRLLWADAYRIGQVDLPDDIPTSLAEALWYDDPEKQLQHRGTARVGRGRIVAAFHGHGVPEEKGNAKLETFLRTVDRGLEDLIDPSASIVLAGVEDITARFRSLSKHRGILEKSISGNPDELAPQELHRRAADLMRPILEGSLRADAEAFLAGGDLVSSRITDVVPAAVAGRVEALFIPVGTHVWGRVGDGIDVIVHETREPGDPDLLDIAGAATWSTGGRVHAVASDEVPGSGDLAAIFRY